MTIDEFVAIIKEVVPDVARYQRIRKPTDHAYAVWIDYGTSTKYADGIPVEKAKKIQVDYFTHTEDDPAALRLFNAFSEHDEIVCNHLTDFEEDTRYIHHIFDCEVIVSRGTI